MRREDHLKKIEFGLFNAETWESIENHWTAGLLQFVKRRSDILRTIWRVRIHTRPTGGSIMRVIERD